MKLGEIFQNLSHGPMGNLALLGEGSGVIPEASYPRLTALLNSALGSLYSKFRLSQKTLILQAQEGMYLYYLRPQFSLYSGIPGSVKYILDTFDEPFLDDIQRIELISDSDGNQYDINNRTAISGTVFVPAFDCIQLLEPVAGAQYTVEYRATHAKIPLGNTDMELDIQVPSAYLETLLTEMAGKHYRSMNGQDNTLKGQEFLSESANLVSEHQQNNTDLASQSSTNMRPKINGWA